MKRFGVVVLVFSMLAILGGGFVKPALAQPAASCLGREISGGSGRSVCSNGSYAWWTWTAPTAGTFIFDTESSNFDTLLVGFVRVPSPYAVFEILFSSLPTEGPIESEVRISAQQGQRYAIGAIRADGSFAPGTLVLNWRPASADGGNDGGSRVSNDDFTSSTAISGASGRSEGSNVGAGKESGEPAHADYGGASVWWTWTAPATGPVTFDTNGSDFDTLLAVYTGSRVSRLTEVAANDDSGGNSWSGVRFNAQQGQAYHVAVDGWDGETGAIMLNWRAAAPEDDCLSLEISGASGSSVCENSLFAVWTWTAPTTDTFVFDTEGSDFDTRLAYGDLPHGLSIPMIEAVARAALSQARALEMGRPPNSEVRISAQQGQRYAIGATSVDDSSDPGTLVLNWRPASAGTGNGGNGNVGGGSRVSNDDFASKAALSGSSGRREGSNVGADVESGEPNHAGNSGGASVWWTWTAPATGTATFHTLGSDFDTLLAVYTGASLNRLAPVASNDDAGSGSVQSEVSFTAQRGQTYHVAVDGYGGATGVIHLTWRAASAPGATPTAGLREQFFANPGPGKPNYVFAGQNASLQYWLTPDGDASQTLYKTADGTQRVRIFHDAQTGAAQTVLDEGSGHWLSIRAFGPDRVDFWAYDASGSYLGGFALYEKSGRYYTGQVAGIPAHDGNPISGRLTADGGSWTGTFTLTIDPEAGLTNIQEAPPEIVQLIDIYAPTDPIDAGPASDNRIEGLSDPVDAGPASDSRIEGLSDTEKGAPASMRSRLTKGGLALAAAGGAVALIPGGQVIGGAMALAGASAFFSAQVLPAMADRIRKTFGGSCPDDGSHEGELCADLANLAADGLAAPDERGPLGYAQDALDWIMKQPSRLADKVARGGRQLSKVAGRLVPGDADGSHDDDEPASPIAPPTVDADLTGEMTGPDGSRTQLTGTLNTSGNFNANGLHARGLRAISGRLGSDGSVEDGAFQHGSKKGKISAGGGYDDMGFKVKGNIPNQSLTVGKTLTLNLTDYITYVNTHVLNFKVSCVYDGDSEPEVSYVGASGRFTLTPDREGVISCKVYGMNYIRGIQGGPHGSFQVTVKAKTQTLPPPSGQPTPTPSDGDGPYQYCPISRLRGEQCTPTGSMRMRADDYQTAGECERKCSAPGITKVEWTPMFGCVWGSTYGYNIPYQNYTPEGEKECGKHRAEERVSCDQIPIPVGADRGTCHFSEGSSYHISSCSTKRWCEELGGVMR